MSNGLDKLAGGMGEAIQTVPELYQGAFQPAVQETGKLLARIPRAINAAFSGLDKWILNKEYSIDETKKLLAQKLENVDPNKIVEPEPYVAIPAIQAISYSMDSEELRDLYANLLAKAMIKEIKKSVHPSFVEIIKQMSPIDAIIFKKIMEKKNGARPLITISERAENGGNLPIYENCSWIKDYSIKTSCTSFDSLSRLGLIQLPLVGYADDSVYDEVINNPLFKDAEIIVKRNLFPKMSLYHEKRFIKLNELSTQFYNICVLDKNFEAENY